MTRTKKIIYWVATLWLSLGMISTGIVQLIKMKEEADMFTRLGYPDYLLPILGVWKVLGVIAILAPRLPLLKEWAYAGFFFAMSGAIVSHAVAGDKVLDFIGPTLLLVLTIVSWHYRPEEKRLVRIDTK